MTIRGPFAVTLLVVLFVSLAANLVIAGFTVARFAGPRPGGGGEIDRIVALGIRAFPPEIQGDISESGARPPRRVPRRARRGRRTRASGCSRRCAPTRSTARRSTRPSPTCAATTNDVQAIGQTIVADAIANAPPDVRARIRPPRGPFP